MGEPFISKLSAPGPKVKRVVYANGDLKVNLLLFVSLPASVAIRTKSSRRITEPGLGPLFFGTNEEEGDFS
jgi:hypothetical protein